MLIERKYCDIFVVMVLQSFEGSADQMSNIS